MFLFQNEFSANELETPGIDRSLKADHQPQVVCRNKKCSTADKDV